MENEKKLETALDNFIQENPELNTENCTTQECKIKQDKSLLERINKKIIIEDGRQLLF